MKIAMEALQQKLEDKDKEKQKFKQEYKQYIHELKHDKKRYVELLELRDKEMAKLTSQVSTMTHLEQEYKQKLCVMESQLENFKTRDNSHTKRVLSQLNL